MNFRLTYYFRQSLIPAFLLLMASSNALATVAVVTYGDDDGFGAGATTFKNVNTNSNSPGEAPFTDQRLIGDGFFLPGFAPAATLHFAPFSSIGSVVMTLRLAGYGSSLNPVAPNALVVNGVALPTGLLDLFSPRPDTTGPNVETQSIALAPNFFALFAGGSIDLTGTSINEASGASSFQVDFLRFEIEGNQVPEPSSIGMMLAAGAAVAWRMRRRAA
ncbi:MAG: PEP-CTERM sorting domain-containing protein [Bryobacterales bacterium]|nr:PEP-CTERM sorting domain-containing protein [Bryobacterales bacterium]